MSIKRLFLLFSLLSVSRWIGKEQFPGSGHQGGLGDMPTRQSVIFSFYLGEKGRLGSRVCINRVN